MKRWAFYLFIFIIAGYVFAQEVDTVVSTIDSINTETIFLKHPTDLKIKPIDDQSVTISWQDNSNSETGFIVERRTMNTQFMVIGKVSDDETEFVDNELLVGEKYYYQIKAEYEFNESIASDKVTVETEFVAPTNFKVEALDDQSTRLTWEDVYDFESGFRIERKTNNDEFEEIAVIEANSRYYVDEELEDSKTYIYTVKVFTEIN